MYFQSNCKYLRKIVIIFNLLCLIQRFILAIPVLHMLYIQMFSANFLTPVKNDTTK